MDMMFDFAPFWLSLQLAFLTTLVLFIIALPFAYIFSFWKIRLRVLWESLISLPLVLPPTVLGFYILLFFAPDSFIGHFFDQVFGIRLIFNFYGLLIASCIFSFPFMFNPLRDGMKKIPRNMIEVSYTLGKTRFETLRRIILPNIIPSLITGLITTFSHTVGAFGILLMVGGNIPGVTKVASIALYEKVEALDFSSAHMYSFILLALSFVSIISVNIINHRLEKRFQ